jgi:hypothetical protein
VLYKGRKKNLLLQNYLLILEREEIICELQTQLKIDTIGHQDLRIDDSILNLLNIIMN